MSQLRGESPAVVPQQGEVASLIEARARVLHAIDAACARTSRDPRGVTLVAVTKTVPAERVRAAMLAGLGPFGENRVQEAEAKRPLVPGASWHLIGPLQSNKARRAVETFDVIQTVDSIELARRLDRIVGDLRPDAPLSVLLQVNVDRDPAKAGFDFEALESSLPEILACPGLRVDGLMTIGRLVADPDAARPAFRALRELAGRLRERFPALGPALSMGMSEDYRVAVEEGATLVRVGRALFGERPT
jgi:PLP dependent protein